MNATAIVAALGAVIIASAAFFFLGRRIGIAAEVRRLTMLGAKQVADFDEGGHVWTTLLDPEGNEFDVITGHSDGN